MVLIILVGGSIGWEANRVTRMRRAVAVLERPVAGLQHAANWQQPSLPSPELAPQSRVQVFYDEIWLDDKYQDQPRFAWLPRWVRDGIGADHFRWPTRLDFGRRPTPEDWEAIAALGSITGLVFNDDQTTDSDLTGLAACPSLVALDLGYTGITDRALPLIGRLKALRHLHLSSTATTDQGLATLTGLTQLEELSLGDKASTDLGFAHLRGLTRLRRLTASGGKHGLTDAGLAHLRGLVELEDLSLTTTSFTAAGLAHLVALPKLRTLGFQADISFNFSDELEDDKVKVEPFSITASGAEQLGKLAHLEVLSMLFMPSNDDTLRAIGRLTELRELEVGGDAITGDGVAALAHLTHLKELTMFAPRLTDAGLATLGQLSQLETLAVMDSSAITDTGLAHLRPLARLEVLALSGAITSEGIEQFQVSRPQRIHISQLPSRSRPPRPAAGNP